MKLHFKLCSILLLFLISASSFAQKKTPFQINGELFEFPGKWEYKDQLKHSGQFYLSNKAEKIILSVSVRKPEKFEFYKEGLTEKELLNAFYKWEYDYWASSNGVKADVSEVKRNEEKNYIIWKITLKDKPQNDHKNLTSYLLYAVRNNKLISFNLTNNIEKKNPLTETESIELLEQIYLK
ncbi:hypothetical protein QWZ06_03055 [Chryseobacterium tructae]|uniref:DUF3805 domain-containing protein n=1 Tax=Chryseobacterium tructae TaxID=1037380 RepID=A0ABV7XSV7_9FLAO|nr:hypothetical protein [Chryseobacterium tructae]MDN3691310.1 hypothetical protein [Chryseobacterium tructae]